jgi:hypothetical protein
VLKSGGLAGVSIKLGARLHVVGRETCVCTRVSFFRRPPSALGPKVLLDDVAGVDYLEIPPRASVSSSAASDRCAGRVRPDSASKQPGQQPAADSEHRNCQTTGCHHLHRECIRFNTSGDMIDQALNDQGETQP